MREQYEPGERLQQDGEKKSVSFHHGIADDDSELRTETGASSLVTDTESEGRAETPGSEIAPSEGYDTGEGEGEGEVPRSPTGSEGQAPTSPKSPKSPSASGTPGKHTPERERTPPKSPTASDTGKSPTGTPGKKTLEEAPSEHETVAEIPSIKDDEAPPP
jgi:hypothetical protein